MLSIRRSGFSFVQYDDFNGYLGRLQQSPSESDSGQSGKGAEVDPDMGSYRCYSLSGNDAIGR